MRPVRNIPSRKLAEQAASTKLLKSLEEKKEQKRLQNRLAQRTYRQNQKQRVQALEAAVRASSNMAFLSPPTTGVPILPESVPQVLPTPPGLHELGGLDDPHLWPINTNLSLDWNEPSSPSPSNALSTGRAALHLAASKGDQKMTTLLLDSGADVCRQDGGGCTALHLAAEAGHDDVVKVLLGKSADPTMVDHLGQTVLFHAVKTGNESTARLLLNYPGTDINAKDSFGHTALHVAVEAGLEQMVVLLLALGADINA